MEQLTIRGLGKELERRIRELARRKGISLNRAALELLRKGAGIAEPKPHSDVVGDSLDRFIGSWSADQEREFLKEVEIFEDSACG